MKKNIRSLARNTDGLSTVEYVIILMLIAVVGIVAWRTFGNTVVSKINAGNGQISGLGGA
jgi:Flp pilus assembly pilin Flp